MDRKLEIVLTAKDMTGSAFTNLQARLKKAGDAVFSFKGAIALAAGATGIGLLIDKNLKAADAIGKAADRIGINTTVLQEYRYAAGLAGVETKSLDKGLAQFTKRLGEAQAGTGALVYFLNKYDKSLLQNLQHTGSVDEALSLLYKTLGGTKDAADRAALANAAFGRSGIEMTVMLKKGAKGLEEMRREAHDLGIILDDDLIRNSERADDEVSKLAQVLKMQMTIAVASLAPEIAAVAQHTTDWWKANKELVGSEVSGYVDKIAAAVKKMAGIYDELPDGIVGAAGAGLVGRILLGGPKGWLIGAIPLVTKQLEALSQKLSGMGLKENYEEFKAINEMAENGVAWGDVFGGGRNRPGGSGGGGSFGVSNELKNRVASIADALKNETKKINLPAVAGDQFNGIPMALKDTKKLADQVAKLQQEALKSVAPDIPNMANELEKALADPDQYFGKMEKAAEKSSNDLIDLSQRTADAMEQNFSDFFFDALTGQFKSLGDYARGILRSIQRAFGDYLGQGLKQLLFGTPSTGSGNAVSGAVAGGAVGAIGSAIGDYTSLWTGSSLIFHQGGVVGETAVPSISAPSSLFINAPRLHSGLYPDEYPAILQRGETVIPRSAGASSLSKNAAASTYNIVINAVDAKSFNDMVERNPQAITTVVSKTLRDGGLRNEIREATA